MLLLGIVTILDRLSQLPPDIWHDPNALALLGIGAGIFGALATIGAAIYTVRQGRTKRRIEYQVVSDAPIVAVDSTVSGKVQILFNGQPAEDTRVLVLKVRNAGNSSIRKKDYFEPLSFEFDTEVISADVLTTEPLNLLKPDERKNFLVLEKQKVQFLSFPLNRRDALTISVLLKDESAVRANGRLDQGTITKLRPNKEMVTVILSLAVTGAGASVLLLLVVLAPGVISGALEALGALGALALGALGALATVALGAIATVVVIVTRRVRQ